jgi:hypothetical protein
MTLRLQNVGVPARLSRVKRDGAALTLAYSQSPARCSFLIFRFIRSRFKALICVI